MLEFMDVGLGDRPCRGAGALDRVRQLEPAHPQISGRPRRDDHPGAGLRHLADGRKGDIKLVRKSIDWFLVSGENEAFYLRVYTAGDYRYHGADMGILVSRGRFQTDDRQAHASAPRHWVAAIHRQFEAIPVTGSSAPTPPPVDATQQDVLKTYSGGQLCVF